MAMATTPIISPTTSSSSTLHRKNNSRNIQQQYQHYQQQQQQPFSPPSSVGRNPSHNGNTIVTPATTPPPPLKQQHQTTSTGGGNESPRFRLSKLLAPLQTHHLHHSRSEQDQQLQQLQSPLSPQQQHQYQQQAPHRTHHTHNHSHRFFCSKHANPSRFRRGGRGGGGGFFGFLQSHYHAFHRSQDQQQAGRTGGYTNDGSTTSNIDKRENAAAQTEREKEQQRRRRAITAVSPRSPEGGAASSFMSNKYSGINNATNANSNNNSSTVHSGYNMTISDFRAHATISSTRSETLPTKVTDVVFERRPSFKKRDSSFTSVATPPMTPPPFPNTNTNGGGFRASLRSLGILGPATSSSPSPPPTATTTPTQPRFPTSPPRSPTLSATTPLPLPVSVHPAQASAVSSSSSSPTSKQRRMSFGQGFLCKDRNSSCRDGSPSSSPSTSKLASSSKSWLPGKMAFLYPKRKPSLPLQSHYLSLPVGSPTNGAGMYMLHSEDLSVTEFAKLAGITIVQDEDDPTTYEASHMIGNEIHEHRRGSSTTELTAPPMLDLGASRSAENTLNSERNLTMGSSGSFGGASRKTQIWDPQFWSEPVRDAALTMPTAASYNKLLLPSASTSSLPINSGSFATRSVPVLVGNSAPNSPRLKPQSSLPSSGLYYGASSSSTTRIQTPTTFPTLSPPVQQQRRRNSCSPAVLMPAAGSKAVATGTATGSEIVHARHLTSTGVLSLKGTDQQQLPRPPSKDAAAIQLSQDLGRRRSFTSLTAVALELEGGAGGESGLDLLKSEGAMTGALGDIPTATSNIATTTTATPCLFLEPSTPTTPTKTALFIHPPAAAPPSMSHTLAMQAIHTPKTRQSVPPGGGGGGHSSRKGVSRTRSPSPSPLSRQIDLNSLESPQEEKCNPLDEPRQWRERSGSSLSQLSPPPLMNPSSSKSSRQCLAHGKSGKATKPATTTAAMTKESRKHLTATVPTTNAATPVTHHRAQSMPLSLSDQQSTNTQRRSPSSTSGSKTPSPSPASTSRSNSPSPSPNPNPHPDRKFTPGTKVGRFTLVQERCTKHVDLLKAQQAQHAQRRASMGEMGLPPTNGGGEGDRKGMYLSPNSSSSTSSLDTIEWVDNPMLKPEDNVRVFQRKRSRRILDPQSPPLSLPQHPLSRPPLPPVS